MTESTRSRVESLRAERIVNAIATTVAVAGFAGSRWEVDVRRQTADPPYATVTAQEGLFRCSHKTAAPNPSNANELDSGTDVREI